MTIKNIELVERLRQILDLEVTYPPVLITITFLFLNSINNSLPTLTILIIAIAKMAIPFIVYVLLVEKKYIWLISLLIFIIIPSVIIYSSISESVFSKYFLLIPFMIFYFYCVLLKYAVRDWFSEAEAKAEHEEMKSEMSKSQTDK